MCSSDLADIYRLNDFDLSTEPDIEYQSAAAAIRPIVGLMETGS